MSYDRALFWRTAERAAARAGKWKYIADAEGEFLFDVVADEGEKADLRVKEPAAFARVKQQYLDWNARMLRRPARVATRTAALTVRR